MKGKRPTVPDFDPTAGPPIAVLDDESASSGDVRPTAYSEELLRFGGDVSRETPVITPLPKPATPRVLAVSNQKGGVGKTSSAVNLAAALAEGGLTVLVIDMDPQGNASTALGIDRHADAMMGVYDVLVADRPLLRTVRPCPDVPDLWVAPATIDLAGAEIELVAIERREFRLREALDRLRQQLARNRIGAPDYVLIDCPPSLGLLTLNALVAAEEILIPIQCEYYALEGLGQLIRTVEMVTQHLNPGLHISAILLTMTDSRTRLSDQVADDVRGFFGDLVLKTAIPRSVRLSEAPGYGRSGLAYDTNAPGSQAYRAAAQELVARTIDLRSTTQQVQA